MDAAFDPYRKWLGIPRDEQPPHHYRLLGLRVLEEDLEVISHAADRQMLHVRGFQSGPHSQESQKLLNELAAARVCLLDPAKKASYDEQLRAAIARRLHGQQAGPPFGLLLQGAARYVLTQARRWWLTQARLASAELALGLELHRLGRYRGRFPALSEQLDRVMGALAARPPQPDPRPPAASFRGLAARIGAWPWAVARHGRLMILGHLHRRLLRRLAQGAFAVDGVSCGPSRWTAPVQETRTRLELLRAEARRLSDVPVGQVLSPARVAWLIAGILLGLVLLLLWLRIVL